MKISREWREKLSASAKRFAERWPTCIECDIELTYNYFPHRIDGKIPPEILRIIGKTLAKQFKQNADEKIRLIHALLARQSDESFLIACYLTASLQQQEAAFLSLFPVLFVAVKHADQVQLVADLVIIPYIIQYSEHWKSFLRKLAQTDNAFRMAAIFISLKKFHNKEDISVEDILVFCLNLLTSDDVWDDFSEKAAQQLAKDLARKAPREFETILQKKQFSFDPLAVFFLSEGAKEVGKKAIPIVEEWSQSGNVRIKRIGLSTLKLLKKKKK